MASRRHFDKWSFYGHDYKGNVFIYVEDVKESGKVDDDGFKPCFVSGRWFAIGEHFDSDGKMNQGTFKALEFVSYEGQTVITFDVDVPGDGVSKYCFTTRSRVYNCAISGALFNAYIYER